MVRSFPQTHRSRRTTCKQAFAGVDSPSPLVAKPYCRNSLDALLP